MRKQRGYKKKQGHNMALFLVAIMAPALFGRASTAAQTATAGKLVEVRNVRFDPDALRVNFFLVNLTEKAATAWALQFTSNYADGPPASQWSYTDTIGSIALEELGGIPAGVLRPHEALELKNPAARRADNDPILGVEVKIVSIVFEDNTSYGDPFYVSQIYATRQVIFRELAYWLREIDKTAEQLPPDQALKKLLNQLKSTAGPVVPHASPQLHDRAGSVKRGIESLVEQSLQNLQRAGGDAGPVLTFLRQLVARRHAAYRDHRMQRGKTQPLP